MNQNKIEKNYARLTVSMCILSQNLGSISLHPSGPSKSFMCPALPKILCALGIDMLKKVDSKKKCNRLHNNRQKGTYTRLHWPHVILNTMEKSSPRKGTKGIRCHLWNLWLPSHQKSDSSPHPESHGCNPHIPIIVTCCISFLSNWATKLFLFYISSTYNAYFASLKGSISNIK